MTTSTIVAICTVAAVIAYHVYRYFSFNTPLNFDALMSKVETQDTLYFKTVDVLGKMSAVHDSGIKPSSVKGKDRIFMNVVKYEYIDGIETILDKPVEIAIGQNIYNLTTNIKLNAGDVQDKKGYYTIAIDNLWK